MPQRAGNSRREQRVSRLESLPRGPTLSCEDAPASARAQGMARHPLSRDRKAFRILGPPAAGESTNADPIAIRRRARIMDSGEAQALLPEYGGGRRAGTVHRRHRHITSALEATALGEKIVLPTDRPEPGPNTGADGTVLSNRLRDALSDKEFPTLRSLRRACRVQETGRVVDSDWAIACSRFSGRSSANPASRSNRGPPMTSREAKIVGSSGETEPSRTPGSPKLYLTRFGWSPIDVDEFDHQMMIEALKRAKARLEAEGKLPAAAER